MNIIIVGGFLGSGKTTTLLALAKYLSDQKRLKVAIIENEVGSVGIDGEYLKEYGFLVKEIYSGCICCSLRIDIIQTLLELERNYEPDIVLLEPSGVANPSEVLRSLDGYSGNIDSKQLVTIIDSVRFSVLEDYSMPLITDSLSLAQLIIINKTDLISETDLVSLTVRIKEINKNAEILSTSCSIEDKSVEICERLNQPIENAARLIKFEDSASGLPGHDNSIAYAKGFETLSEPINSTDMETRLDTLLTSIALQLKAEGCNLIGHLKAIAKGNGNGYLVASKTSFDHPVQFKGKLTKTVLNINIVLNLIVYSIGKEQLKTIADKEIEAVFTPLTIK